MFYIPPRPESEHNRQRRLEQQWNRDGLLRSLQGDKDPWRPYPGTADESYSRSTEPGEDSRLRQDRAKGQRYVTDKKIGSVAPGESQPDSDAAIVRRRQQAPSDFEYLENPEK